MMKVLITLTLFVALYIFWPPDVKSIKEVTPYISDIDLILIWVLVGLWLIYLIYYLIKEWKGGAND